jgi:hypothetical protein
MNDLEKFEESLRALKPRRPDSEAAERIQTHLREQRPPPAARKRLAPLAWAAAALAACVLISVLVRSVTQTPPRQPPLRTGSVPLPLRHVRLEPTLRVYRMALARSPEALDALLLEQAKTTLVRTRGSDILSPI